MNIFAKFAGEIFQLRDDTSRTYRDNHVARSLMLHGKTDLNNKLLCRTVE
jgi:hypothetical protein